MGKQMEPLTAEHKWKSGVLSANYLRTSGSDISRCSAAPKAVHGTAPSASLLPYTHILRPT